MSMIFGGLAQGLGRGITLTAAQKREDMLNARKEARRKAEIEGDRNFKRELIDEKRSYEEGQMREKLRAEKDMFNRKRDFLKLSGSDKLDAVDAGLISPEEAYGLMSGTEKAEFGVTPIWGTDENGKDVIIQLSKTGRAKQTELPEGFTPTDPYQRKFDEAKGTADGKAQSQKEGTFGIKSAAFERNLKLVDSIIEHEYLPNAVGPIDGRLPTFRSGTTDFDERVQQLNSVAFMEAREELKGGGQITDFEGQKAEKALLRASQAKSEEDFIKAMTEFKEALIRGYQILENQVGGAAKSPGNSGPKPAKRRYNPESGELETIR